MEKFGAVILFNSMECTQESHTEGVILPLKSTGMINMKALSLVLLLISSSVLADSYPVDQARHQALIFNKWYIKQISQSKYPITDGHEIDKYVATDTLKKLRHPNVDGEEDYGPDFFLRAQDYDNDWPDNVNVIQSDFDPVCTNVYVAFGKAKKHVVVDCMIKESGTWKIQSVTNLDIMPE